MELFNTLGIFESEPYEFLVNIVVCTDDNSMYVNDIESDSRLISNVSLESLTGKTLLQ